MLSPPSRGHRRLKIIAAVAFAALGLCSGAGANEADPGVYVRRTQSGLVQGLSDGDIISFRGIPFAAPPIGQLRWHAPTPPAPWTGVRPATQYASDCYGIPALRKGTLAPGMSEDCLYLNIWAPHGQTGRQHPVMVWIYGGGFVGGTSAVPYYDGSALAKKGVVVVTFNYRTNIFGFFAHPGLSRENPAHTSGNYGLLDMLAALGWVKQNIAAFDGDPSRVTVFGESAGASAIGLLLTSPLSHGLFSSAILESPGLMRPLATLSEAEAAGTDLGDDLAQLRSLDAESLMARAASSVPASRHLKKPRPIGPIIDGQVLPQSDADAIASGQLDHVPVIIGSNADEGRLFVEHAPPIGTVAAYHAYLEAQFGAAAPEFARCYPVTSDKDVMPALSRIFGDNQFNRGIETFANALARLGIPVWRYRFDGLAGSDRLPATHGGELPYVFDAFEPDELQVFSSIGIAEWGTSGATPADRVLSRKISAAWANFAVAQNPNGKGIPYWPAYKPQGPIMIFGSTVGAAQRGQRAVGDPCENTEPKN